MIDLGDVTLIRRVKDPNNHHAGYVYDFEVGQSFSIPACAWIRADHNGGWHAQSNCGDKSTFNLFAAPMHAKNCPPPRDDAVIPIVLGNASGSSSTDAWSSD